MAIDPSNVFAFWPASVPATCRFRSLTMLTSRVPDLSSSGTVVVGAFVTRDDASERGDASIVQRTSARIN